MEVVANTAFSIKLPVLNLAGSIDVSDTISVLIQKSGSDACWGTGSGGAYTTRALATLPTATLVTSGECYAYTVPAGATTGLADMTDLDIVMINNTTPGSITAMSAPLHVQVRTAAPAIVGSAVNVTQIGGNALQSSPSGTMPGPSTLLVGTASAGSTTSITLAGGIATDNIYNGNLVVITSGTGAHQARTILDYTGSTKVAVITRNWVVAPDNTSHFAVMGADIPTILDTGDAQAGAASTITLHAASSSSDNVYNGNWVFISSGTGTGQTRQISAYVGSTKVATVTPSWTVNPDSTSVYQIQPSGPVTSVTGAVGSVTGAVGSVTGAVGSVTGAVGSVTGSVGSVTGNVGGDVTGKVLGSDSSTLVNPAVIAVGSGGSTLSSGANVTITVTDGSGNGVPACSLAISGGNPTVTTNSSGVAVTQLVAGTYTVTPTSIGFTGSPASLTANAGSNALAITMSAVGAQNSPASNKALIFGFTQLGSGVSVLLYNKTTPSLSALTDTSSASPNGYFDFQSVLPGQVYRVASADTSINGLTLQAPAVGVSSNLQKCITSPGA